MNARVLPVAPAGARNAGRVRAVGAVQPLRRRARPSPAQAPAHRTAAEPVSKQALRLLSALNAAGAYAVVDPTQNGMVLVRANRDGVSLGAGLHALASAEDLLRRDLVQSATASSGRASFRISEAGRAHLRRKGAMAGEVSPYRTQHHDLVEAEIEVDGERACVRKNAEESPLDWLRRRKDRQGQALVDEAGYEAGERLRRDLTLAGMLPGVTARWDGLVVDRGRSGGSRDPAQATDAALAARQRVTKALDAVGSDFADLLTDLCGFLKGLEMIERERGWPLRSAKVVAKLALTQLADHYGLAKSARGPQSRGVRAWRAAGLDDEQAAPAAS